MGERKRKKGAVNEREGKRLFDGSGQFYDCDLRCKVEIYKVMFVKDCKGRKRWAGGGTL